MNPAYTPEQVVSALRHISAACFIVSTEITLPYKEPKSTSSLLAAVIGNGRDGISSIVLSLRNVMLVDNSSGRKCSFLSPFYQCVEPQQEPRHQSLVQPLIITSSCSQTPTRSSQLNQICPTAILQPFSSHREPLLHPKLPA